MSINGWLLIDDEGPVATLTEAGKERLTAFRDAADAAINHPGGRLAAHERQISRNTYTVDPRQPTPDQADDERSRLLDRAADQLFELIEGGISREMVLGCDLEYIQVFQHLQKRAAGRIAKPKQPGL